MTDEPELTDDEVRVLQLFETCRYRLLIHSAQTKPDFIFDAPITDEPPGEPLIMEVNAAVEAGDTVLLSFADAKRREFVNQVAREVGWKCVKIATSPPSTRHER